ncbi:Peroxidase [Mycena indigotica]|uniref:Peroxidase n=1 Tax=Mycena indigotica TaxID=2126181 RepID=A0A8H6SS66_9AGAR|nr:Peroxidase [Mycena indigotica]KAF7303907.1 Peroxidase [Mycena indigotica]
MGSFAPTRQLVVDDTDPRIQYGAQDWFIADPNTLTSGNFGSIFNGTSHGTTSNNSTLLFPFNGTSIEVWGTISVATTNNLADPSWDCYVDDVRIPNPDPTFRFEENNWLLCAEDSISKGSHTLRIQVHSAGRPFYLDYIKYRPLSGEVSRSASVVAYSNTDPAVSFSTGWVTFGGENATDVNGAQVALHFRGTSASMYGFVPTERPHNATCASYSIDNGQPINFTLRGLADASDTTTQYNVMLFTTPLLEDKEHNLVVTYHGDRDHTPLVLQSFYVFDSPDIHLSTSSSPPTASSGASKATRYTSVGAITGGTIAGAFILAVLAVVAFCLRQTRRKRALEAVHPTPFPLTTRKQEISNRFPVATSSPACVGSSQLVPHLPGPDASARPRSVASRPSTIYPSVMYADSLNASFFQPSSDVRSSWHSHNPPTPTLQPSAASSRNNLSTEQSFAASLPHAELDATPTPNSSSFHASARRDSKPNIGLALDRNPAAAVLQQRDSGVRIGTPPGYSSK